MDHAHVSTRMSCPVLCNRHAREMSLDHDEEMCPTLKQVHEV